MSSKSRKRANGEGSITKVGSKYKGSLTMGHDAHGKQVRRYFTADSHAEAQERLAELVAERGGGVSVAAHKLTVRGFITQWLDYKRHHVRAKTFTEYEHLARTEITPRLGHVLLTRLQPLDVERMVTTMVNEGQSARKAQTTLKVLKVALRQAVDWGLLRASPAIRARAPRQPHQDLHVWTPGEARTFLAAASGNRLYALFYLALDTGMRRGELLGLHWKDVDLAKGIVRVRHNLVEVGTRIELGEPKTRASRRVISLAPDTVQVLHDHRLNQLLELGHEPPMVFASTVGTFVQPSNLARSFRAITATAGVPRIRLHDLRHTAASLAIRNGADLKALSERLGHATPSITLNVYYHAYAEQRQHATVSLTQLLA